MPFREECVERDCPVDDVAPMRIPLRQRNGIVVAYAIIDTVDFRWVGRWRWHLTSNGYVARKEWDKGNQSIRYLHRDILGLRKGDRLIGDHIDRNRLNCRRSNLRSVTIAGSRQNQSGHRESSSSYRGVTWVKRDRKWAASITLNYKHISLGYYDGEEDAAQVASDARKKHYPYAVD